MGYSAPLRSAGLPYGSGTFLQRALGTCSTQTNRHRGGSRTHPGDDRHRGGPSSGRTGLEERARQPYPGLRTGLQLRWKLRTDHLRWRSVSDIRGQVRGRLPSPRDLPGRDAPKASPGQKQDRGGRRGGLQRVSARFTEGNGAKSPNDSVQQPKAAPCKSAGRLQPVQKSRNLLFLLFCDIIIR